MTTNKSILYVDFNEMLEPNLVLLSAGDYKRDVDGRTVLLHEGMEVEIYMDDVDKYNNPDNLVASGVVEKNTDTGWSSHVKWCCRIDGDGIRNVSDLKKSTSSHGNKD